VGKFLEIFFFSFFFFFFGSRNQVYPEYLIHFERLSENSENNPTDIFQEEELKFIENYLNSIKNKINTNENKEENNNNNNNNNVEEISMDKENEDLKRENENSNLISTDEKMEEKIS
jgi:hypothetical protein